MSENPRAPEAATERGDGAARADARSSVRVRLARNGRVLDCESGAMVLRQGDHVVVDCGEEVLVVARESGSGAASGATVSSRIYLVVTVREQKIRRWREFYDESAARNAAGLTE